MITLIKDMPTSGQFIVIWRYKGKPWSNVWRWHEGDLQEYDAASDAWTLADLWDESCVPRGVALHFCVCDGGGDVLGDSTNKENQE